MAELFGKTEGFKVGDPTCPTKQENLKTTSDGFSIPTLEEKVADLLVELGVKYEYETEKISYVIEHKYSPDFILPNGVYLECKGYWDSADRRKIKAVKTQHPNLDLRMVFQAPYNTISKKSKTTYAKWCDKNNIPWCSFSNIPIKWLI